MENRQDGTASYRWKSTSGKPGFPISGSLKHRLECYVAGQASQDCSERFSGAMDSDLCMAPVVCDSPALAMAQRSRLQLSHGMPHDSATSLVRLDMHLLPSPLSKGVSVAALGKCEDVHASPHPHGSHDALVWTSEMSHGHATRLAKAPPPQLCLGTRAVPMIISPDEHHEMQCQVTCLAHFIDCLDFTQIWT